MADILTREDGEVLNTSLVELNEHDLTAKAKKVIIVDGDGDAITEANPLPVMAELEVSDIQIGAVEIKDAESGNRVIVNDSGQMNTNMPWHICVDNSSETPLDADGVFLGDWQDTLDYGVVTISVYSDVASATDGLEVQWSANSTDVLTGQSDLFTIGASAAKVFTFGPAARYVRVKYTNGSSAQSIFELQSAFRKTYVKPSSHRIADSIKQDDDAELVKSVLSGEDDYGVFQNAKVDSTGRLNTVSQPYTYSVAEGTIPNHMSLLKFGTRTNVSAGTSSVIWEGTNALYTYLTSAEQLKVTSTSANDTATTGTGARTLTLVGLDGNFDEITETINMAGLTTVTTTQSFIRIFRAYVETSGTLYTNAGTINITNNAATVQLLTIPAGDGQTLMTIWTVPRGKTLYVTNGSFSTNSNKGARVSLFVRQLDGGILYPWQIKYRAFIFSGNENFPFSIPFKIPEKTDIEVRVLTPGSAGITSCGATFEGWYEGSD